MNTPVHPANASEKTNVILEAIQSRNSSPRLSAPGPSDDELQQIMQCALRSPDHAWLRPWRFVRIAEDRRIAFGQRLEASLLRTNPDADDAAREKARKAPLRAPQLIVVMATYKEHPKVPHWEQKVSAGCAAFSMMLAAEAFGYAAVWRTGSYTEDPELVTELGGKAGDEVVAFLYVGTRDCPPKNVPDLEPEAFLFDW